jgi:photosystem II oxygen-evolving enhancer protein 2
MLKSAIAVLCLILSMTITGCVSGVSGLQSYVNPTKGYEFLYPNGWIPVNIQNARAGVDVVFRDLIERTENLSVIVSQIPADKTLEDLGSPSDVGYRFLKSIDNNPDLNRQAEFLRAESRQAGDKTYYLLEYEVTLPSQPPRHNLASVAVSRDRLFTFNLSTTQDRWDRVQKTFEVAAKSFTVR